MYLNKKHLSVFRILRGVKQRTLKLSKRYTTNFFKPVLAPKAEFYRRDCPPNRLLTANKLHDLCNKTQQTPRKGQKRPPPSISQFLTKTI